MSSGHQFDKSGKFSAEHADTVRNALQAILSSNAFAGSKRCQDFLKLVVERTLAGDLESLRERMIGVDMFGRAADYDTSNDAIVRVRATEVRRRLSQYYREASPEPAIRIVLPSGSYVPEFQSAGVAQGEEGVRTPVPSVPANWTRGASIALLISLGTLLVVTVLVVLWYQLHPKTQPLNALQLSLGLPDGISLEHHWHPFENLALSPDGQTLAFAATDATGQSSLWVRPLVSAEAQRLNGTDGALLPFWSPDSQFIGFWADGRLRKIPRSGGVPETIYNVPEISQAAWGRDGTILFARAVNTPIFMLSPGSQSAVAATKLLPGEVNHMWVQFLPDGKNFIYLARTSLAGNDENAKVYAQSVHGGAPIAVLATSSRVLAVPDYLLFVQDQTLFAQPMDWKAVRKVGEPVLLARNVAASPAYLGTSEFTVSETGVLIYGTAQGSSFDRFDWYSRDGTAIGTLDPVIDYQQFTMSKDGKHLALNSFHQHATGSLWLVDIGTNTTTPLTTDPRAQSDPVWSPDSRFVAFNLLPNGGSDPPFIVQKMELGTQQLQTVYTGDERHWVEDWSPDGQFLLTHDSKTLSIIPLTGDANPKSIYSSSFTKDEFHISPDGQLIAYGENRTGRWEVFVASFPSFHYIKQVSVIGGAQPRWRADGRELFFLDFEGKMMSAAVERGSLPKIGIPRALFNTGLIPDPTVNQYAVTDDGSKFLLLEPRKGFHETYSVVLNWPARIR